MSTPTLEQLLTTPTGRRMARERQAIVDQEAAQAAKVKAGDVDRWQAELSSLTPPYEAIRTSVLELLGDLGPQVERLAELRLQVRTLTGYIRKADGTVVNLPEPTPVNTIRHAVDAARAILNRLADGL